jgi:hypothetical protein
MEHGHQFIGSAQWLRPCDTTHAPTKFATTSGNEKSEGLHRVPFTIRCIRSHIVVRPTTSRLGIVASHIGEFAVRDMGWCYYRWLPWPQRKNRKVKMVRAATDTVGLRCRFGLLARSVEALLRSKERAAGGSSNYGSSLLPSDLDHTLGGEYPGGSFDEPTLAKGFGRRQKE